MNVISHFEIILNIVILDVKTTADLHGDMKSVSCSVVSDSLRPHGL